MNTDTQHSSGLPYVEVTEQKRLNEARQHGVPWKKWGPYLSERQWGTVREDLNPRICQKTPKKVGRDDFE
jgi:hypothetical protein